MNRLIGVIVGALILFLVGYFVGARPVGGLKTQIKTLNEEHALELSQVRQEADQALGEGYLWQARAQLLVAAQDVGASNFGTAATRVAEAVAHLQKAHTLPGLAVNLGDLESEAAAALNAVKALEPEAQEKLLKVAAELGALLERRQA